MPKLAAEIWRDFEVGASGTAHKPIKSDIRDWGLAVEQVEAFVVAPGAATVPLFSQGAGVAPIYRSIVGGDLPNPSAAVPGAVYTKPAVPGQILAGLEGDGSFTVANTTGTGAIVLANTPNFTGGTITMDGTNLVGSVAGTNVLYGPDNRLAVQISPTVNFYKAGTTHDFYNFNGTDLYASLGPKTLDLQPSPLISNEAFSALKITQTWNTTGLAAMFDLQITDTASAIGSWFMRARGTSTGASILWYVDKGGSGTYAGNLNVGGVIVLGGKNYASVNGSGQLDSYCAAAGNRLLTATGGLLEFVSNTGQRQFYGQTSGSHIVNVPATAGGASTWPLTTGELINTGTGIGPGLFFADINFNAPAGTDVAIPIKFAAGVTRARFTGSQPYNTGPGAAALNTVQVAVYTAPGAGGFAICLPQALSSITTNTEGATGAFVNMVLNPAMGVFHWWNIASISTVYFRIITPQGAPALGRVTIGVQAL
jgi:hypothetical protein